MKLFKFWFSTRIRPSLLSNSLEFFKAASPRRINFLLLLYVRSYIVLLFFFLFSFFYYTSGLFILLLKLEISNTLAKS
jgi:hypothetical protein